MSTRDAVAVLAAAVLIATLLGNNNATPAPLAAAIPLANPDGTRPGLAPVTTDTDRAAAINLIQQVRTTGRGAKTGYRRTRYGDNWADTATRVPYARNGCATRDDLLARDGTDVQRRRLDTCVVISMHLRDPYTGKSIDWRKSDADAVQVDHVIPLSYGWRMGTRHWTQAKRLRFANDPLNLLPVDGDTNERKGGSGPATWLPPRHGIRCAYAVRWAQVALKYNLPLAAPDRAALLTQCR